MGFVWKAAILLWMLFFIADVFAHSKQSEIIIDAQRGIDMAEKRLFGAMWMNVSSVGKIILDAGANKNSRMAILKKVKESKRLSGIIYIFTAALKWISLAISVISFVLILQRASYTYIITGMIFAFAFLVSSSVIPEMRNEKKRIAYLIDFMETFEKIIESVDAQGEQSEPPIDEEIKDHYSEN